MHHGFNEQDLAFNRVNDCVREAAEVELTVVCPKNPRLLRRGQNPRAGTFEFELRIHFQVPALVLRTKAQRSQIPVRPQDE